MKTATHTCLNHAPVIIAQALTKSDAADRNYLGEHDFIDAETDEVFGSFTVFEHAPGKPWSGFGDEPFCHGFYWQSRYPGSQIDQDSCGPFKTAKAAYNDAQNG